MIKRKSMQFLYNIQNISSLNLQAKAILFKLLPAILLVTFSIFKAAAKPAEDDKPKLSRGVPTLSLHKAIWGNDLHNAFTDLIFFKEEWYCTFREGQKHVSHDGRIRIIKSKDGENWETVAVFEDAFFDLRDPKFSVTPKGKLMINFGASLYDSCKSLTYIESRISTSKEGKTWEKPYKIDIFNKWAWRVSWNQKYAYVVAYHAKEGAALYKGKNAKKFVKVADFKLPANVNETSLLIMPDKSMTALVRYDGADKVSYLGKSLPPYTNWQFTKVPSFWGGPTMILLPDYSILVAGRSFEQFQPKTVLANVIDSTINTVLTLPSGGDTSYAGMVWKDGALYMSYYSSHEGKTKIYFARVDFKPVVAK